MLADHDLDEVDQGLLDLISYVRSHVHCPEQVERFLIERLFTAFQIADEFDDAVTEAGLYGRTHPLLYRH